MFTLLCYGQELIQLVTAAAQAKGELEAARRGCAEL
jgi:hypothetical protein